MLQWSPGLSSHGNIIQWPLVRNSDGHDCVISSRWMVDLQACVGFLDLHVFGLTPTPMTRSTIRWLVTACECFLLIGISNLSSPPLFVPPMITFASMFASGVGHLFEPLKGHWNGYPIGHMSALLLVCQVPTFNSLDPRRDNPPPRFHQPPPLPPLPLRHLPSPRWSTLPQLILYPFQLCYSTSPHKATKTCCPLLRVSDCTDFVTVTDTLLNLLRGNFF